MKSAESTNNNNESTRTEPVGMDVPPAPDSAIHKLSLGQGHKGWTSFRGSVDPTNSGRGTSDLEVFISPNGHWYRRARAGEVAELLVPMKTKGLADMRLTCIDHWRPLPTTEQEEVSSL